MIQLACWVCFGFSLVFAELDIAEFLFILVSAILINICAEKGW